MKSKLEIQSIDGKIIAIIDDPEIIKKESTFIFKLFLEDDRKQKEDKKHFTINRKCKMVLN